MKKRIAQYIGPAAGLVVFTAALFVLHRELRDFHLRDVLQQIHAVPPAGIAAALFLTALNYAVLTYYDMLGFGYIGRTIGRARIAVTSFIAYAFSNNIGFMSVSGSAVRFRLYAAWGLSNLEITKIILVTSLLTFWLGMFAICSLVFMLEPVPVPAVLHLPFNSIRYVGVFFALGIAAYLAFTGWRKAPVTVWGLELEIPRVRLSLSLLATACIDWLLYGGILYLLFPGHEAIPFMYFMSVVLVAQLTGMVSHVPGGVGVFETVFILLLPQAGSQSIGTLVIFRAIYYLLPLCLAALLFGALELVRKRHLLTGAVDALRQAEGAIMPYVAAFITFFSGMILQFSGATPSLAERLHFLKPLLPLPVLELSHFLGSIIGLALLLLSWGVYRRLDAAYHLVAYLLAAGVLASLLKGADYEEALALTVMAGLFLPCKQYFYRKTSLFSEPLSPGWLAAVMLVMTAAVWIGMFTHKHVEYSNELWWQFSFDSHASRFLRASFGGALLLGLIALRRLFAGPGPRRCAAGPDEIEKARSIAGTFPSVHAQLALLGDKSFLFSRSGSSFIMYGVYADSWIALHDPVGPPEDAFELIWAFFELADRNNARAVFYEIGTEQLTCYLDMGLALLKLGEEGLVDLQGFRLEGSAGKSLRQSKIRAEKTGCSFEIIAAEQVPPHLQRFREISDSWLADKHTREKRFSLGYFNPDYLRLFPAAVVKTQGRIVAFANILAAQAGSELSIDLMRYTSQAPPAVMDYLLVSLMEWGRKQGYRWFSLGMAPFSGLEARSLAPVWNKFGSFLFSHGENFYNFQGLRYYKDKFKPVWSPRYLAAPGGLSLPIVLKDVSALIAGGAKGVIAK